MEYDTNECRRFVADMENAGFEVEHYHGRYMWEGPAVRTDNDGWPTLQDVMSATKVRLQWDSLGFNQIVYPVRAGRLAEARA